MIRLTLSLLALTHLVGCAAPAPPVEGSLAFTDVRVLTMTDAGVIERGHVVVEGGRIASVAPGPLPGGFAGRRIDGAGATLMPGLVDMHVHYYEDGAGVLYLANSTTTVRNLTGSTAAVARGRLATAGVLAGQRVFTSGPIIDSGTPFAGDFFVRVRTPEEAVGAVRAQAQSGFDAVKLYDQLSPETFRAAVAEAEARGLRVYTHVPDALTAAEVMALGVDSIEHLDGFAQALARDGFAPDRPEGEAPYRANPEFWANADEGKFGAVAEAVARSGVAQVPTFAITLGRLRSADPDAYFARPEAAYLPAWSRYWRDAARGYEANRPFFAAQLDAKTRFVSALREAGAVVLIGTDAPNPFVTPGFSIHEELEQFTRAGYTAEEVLRLATDGAARFLGQGGRLGVVAPGGAADLVLLPRDPAADLSALRAPIGVMVAGHWRDADALDAGLAERAAAMAAARTAP